MNHNGTYHTPYGVLRPWLGLLRVFQCSVAGLLGIVGYEVQSAPRLTLSLKLCGVFAFIFPACASANIINDIRDFRADSIQHPTRPLPSGRISKAAAWVAFICAVGTSSMLASLFGRNALSITLCVMTTGVLYSIWLKNTVLLGNAIVKVTKPPDTAPWQSSTVRGRPYTRCEPAWPAWP
jgi:geranylgeranylglycerol-phosphate geranylgeranyltransferase